MRKETVYVALGGNIGDTAATFDEAIALLALSPAITDLTRSPYYVTTPVSDIPQNDYLNAVCRFTTSFVVEELTALLFQIEEGLGKRPKMKTAPRVIDLDLLFYGKERRIVGEIELPHPRWKERLFVLKPLADLTDGIEIVDEKGDSYFFDIAKMIKDFDNINDERVALREESDRR